ncbi:hypothetical protein [Lacticaseibacillus saniviri]
MNKKKWSFWTILICLILVLTGCGKKSSQAEYTKGGQNRQAYTIFYINQIQNNVFKQTAFPKTTDTEGLVHNLPNYLNELALLTSQSYADPDMATSAQQNVLLSIRQNLKLVKKAQKQIKKGGFPLAPVTKQYVDSTKMYLEQVEENVQNLSIADVSPTAPFSATLLSKNKHGELTAASVERLYIAGYKLLKINGKLAKDPNAKKNVDPTSGMNLGI